VGGEWRYPERVGDTSKEPNLIYTTNKENPVESSDLNYPSFQAIFDEFHPKILRYLSSIVGDLDAEDVTQEVFIKINRALPEFRGESKLSTWVYRVASNAAVDRMRSTAYQQSKLVSVDESVEGQVDDRNLWTGEKVPVLEWQVVRKEMGDCIQDYIRKLPENYRIVLALSELEGLSNQEVADVLGMTIGTVKIRLHRARERLKQDLIDNCPSYWVDGNEFIPDLKDL
jgi:RNA polymerase sigma-70 factor (ECF subfamily)